MSDLVIEGAVDADGEPIDLAIAGGIFVEQAHDAPVLDASGLTAVPGFIDIQMNGGWGHDFTNDPTSIWEVGRVLPRTGVTSFCPTIITSPHDRIEAAQAAMAQRPDGYVGAEPLGLHIEGPHLSEERRGTHPKDLLMPPSGSRLTGDHVAIATIAPELDGAVDLVTTYVMMDIVVSIGHSAATAEQARAAIDAGATLGTHLFNGMPPIGGREPGIAGALLMDQRTRFGVIVDDVHLHDDILAMIWKLAPDRAILITDAIAAAGMPDGRYEIGNIAVEVSEGAVRNDEGNLAGSVLTMDVGLSNIMRRANVALPAAVRALTANPAAALNRPDLGTIAIGNRGDVVLLADDHVVCTVVGGTIAFVQDAESP